MPTTPEEMRLRDVAIGLRAELDEANFQREQIELINAQLCKEIQDLNDRLHSTEVAQKTLQLLTERLKHDISLRDVEIIAIRKSRTWRIGSLLLAPMRWIKRNKS